MTVASGTSTPTSRTVVPTSTSSSPRRKRSIVASRSAAFICPWTTPTRAAGSAGRPIRAAASASWAGSAAATSSAERAADSSSSSTSGTTTKARCPARTSRTMSG